MNAFAPSRQAFTGAQRLEQKLTKQCFNEGDQNGALTLAGAWSDKALGAHCVEGWLAVLLFSALTLGMRSFTFSCLSV